MGFKEMRFRMWDGYNMLLQSIEDWEPKDCNREKDYQESLYLKLHSDLGDISVRKEHVINGYKIDILVDENYLIELKHNLNGKGKLQRLYGQLINYLDASNGNWDGTSSIFVVVCGECEPQIKKDLKKYCEGHGIACIFKD
ncbi:MAG: hypothetical protein ACPGYR_04780 [Chitinophagales bacterium]